MLHFYLDLPLDEVARALRVSPAAAKSRIYRDARRLRSDLTLHRRRADRHPCGNDRITIEFQTGQPSSIELRPQSNSTFTQGASGQSVTLAGSSGLLVVIHGADEHTAYSGATDFKPNYPVLLEARQMEDFEGVVQWGLGLSKSACSREFFLTSPERLVIDIQT